MLTAEATRMRRIYYSISYKFEFIYCTQNFYLIFLSLLNFNVKDIILMNMRHKTEWITFANEKLIKNHICHHIPFDNEK